MCMISKVLLCIHRVEDGGFNQYFGHWLQRANSLEKTLLLGKMEGRRRRG